MKALLEWCLRTSKYMNSKIIILSDSHVAIFALSRFRSSSWRLECWLKRASALCIAGNIAPDYVWARRGGATEFFAAGSGYDACCDQGRWASPTGMRIYLNEIMKEMTAQNYRNPLDFVLVTMEMVVKIWWKQAKW